MRRRWENCTRVAGFALALASLLPSAQAREQVGSGDIAVIPLQGEISTPSYVFLRRALKVAEGSGASAIILEMNTYGGRLDAAEEMTSALSRVSIPTYTFINSNAGSAGSFVALATKHIFMSPVSAIGAAAPVLSDGSDLPATERDKTVSYWSALVRGMAARNSHNPDIGEAFMNKEKEVKIGERMVHARGSLLSLNAQEASEIVNGKPLLAEGVANGIPDLVQKAKLSGAVVQLRPTGFERLAFWITAFAPILLLVGIVSAYLEFKIPGATLPGVVAALCFTLFFLGHYLAGLAGWEAAVLFGLGLAFILVEVFFFAHSTIVLGLVGVFLVLASLLWAMLDRYPDQPLLPSTRMLALPLWNLLLAVIASAVVIALLGRYLPRTSFYRRFALMTSNPPGPSFSRTAGELAGNISLALGDTGAAVTMLRPSGKAQIGERVIDVVTAGEYIAAHTPVVVTQIDRMRVFVRQA